VSGATDTGHAPLSAAREEADEAKMGLHFASNPYLTFQDMTSEGRLTHIVEVIAVRDGLLLGVIKWHGPWRQYVFAPEPACVFNVGCMKTIEHNVRVMNEIRKGRL
jgi:hypothetical protein